MIMDSNSQTKIDQLLSQLPGARELTALELNDMRFSGRKTVITPSRLRKHTAKPSK